MRINRALNDAPLDKRKDLKMGSESHLSTPEIISQKGPSHFLLLYVIGRVLEKYGGSVKIDRNTNTVALSIPQKTKTACCEELEGVIDVIKPFIRLLPSHD